jgi:antitoxin component YwqK of YwqJK toxin-antitoxin module
MDLFFYHYDRKKIKKVEKYSGDRRIILNYYDDGSLKQKIICKKGKKMGIQVDYDDNGKERKKCGCGIRPLSAE